MSLNDTINIQAEQFIKEAVKQRNPDLDLRPGTPQYDLLVAPFLPVVANTVAENKISETKRTVVNWAELSDAEVEAHAGKFFTTRHGGGYSVGSVRLKFSSRRDVSLSSGSPFSQDGLMYRLDESLAVLADDLRHDTAMDFYYTDVAITAKTMGSEYDTIAGSTFKVDALVGLDGFIEAIGSTPMQGGLDAETNQDLYERSRIGLHVRNLVNAPSVAFMLEEVFGSTILDHLVIGAQDPEMLRDLRRIVDPVAGEIAIHLGNHTDVYVQTPILRKAVDIPVVNGQTLVDLSDYRALLKIHSASIKEQPGVMPFVTMIGQDVKTRYSAIDPVKLFVDPAVGGRTLTLDISYAPDVVRINDHVNSPDIRIAMASILVRYFVPVWLYGTIYVDGGTGRTNEAERLISRYVKGVTGQAGLVMSEFTKRVHEAGIDLVHQDFTIGAQLFFGDGDFVEFESETMLDIPSRPDKGCTPRITRFVAEGIIVSALS